MSAVIEAKGGSTMPAGSAQDTFVQLQGLRQFTVDQIGSRLAAEPGLVARFWDQIAKPANPAQPGLTAFYCTVLSHGQTFALLEFVAGETLEALVTGSDPARCEQEIPLFCRLLDAFEGVAGKTNGEATPSADFELLDFGIGRAASPGIAKLHGAVLAGPGETWSEQVFGGNDAGRSEARPVLMEFCARLPGGIRRSSASDPASLGEFTIRSLAPKAQAGEPVAASSAWASLAARSAASPYIIAVGTAMLVLLLLYGVGGFLAKYTGSANAGKLILPSIVTPAAEAPVGTPAAAVPLVRPGPATAATPARKKEAAGQPTPTIVLARGARPIRQTKLLYPVEARRERVSGVVEMQLTIAEDGSVHSPRVLSGDPLLRAGLAEQVSKWVYQPLRVNGKPVPTTTELAIQFSLNP